MARKQHHNSISLFPFLAVLVCAMGALILLLLVMTRKIRNDQALQASTAAAIAQMETAPDLSGDIQVLESEVEALLDANELLQSETSELKSTIVVDETRKNELLRRLNQLQAELEIAKNETKDQELAKSVQSVRDLTKLEKELISKLESIEKSLLEKRSRLQTLSLSKERTAVALAEKNSALISLRKAVDKAEATPPSTGTVTMLEFSNPTGTSRTPIVIEVTEKGYELRPTGVLITPPELDNFPMRDNPLLSAVLTAHRHRVGASVTDEPYVLLLVRPDGCMNFYRAQHILTDARMHFGYELLEADRNIAVGEPDAKEAAKAQQAIAEALQRREKIYARLIEIMKQERGEGAGAESPEGGRAGRRLVVRPDGRVLDEAPESSRPLDGRFYAGGEAPPSNYLKKRPAGGFKPQGEGQMSADEAEKLVDEFARKFAEQQYASNSSQDSSGDQDKTVANEADSRVPMTSLANGMQPPKALASRTAASSTSPTSSESADPAEPASPVLGEESFDEFLSSNSKPQSRANGTAANGPMSFQPEKPAVGTFQGDRFLQPSSNGTSDNPRDYSVITSNQLNSQPGQAMAAAGSPSGTSSAEGSEGSEPSVNEILSAADKKPDLSRVDPDLLKRLETGKGKPSSSLATPIGITVYLDEHHMTVGQLPSVELTQDNMALAFTKLLEGVDQEVKDQQLKPDEPVMPIVKFVVSPGGEQWRVRLLPMMRHIGLHSAAVFELTPYMMPVDESDTTGRATFASHRTGGN